MNIRKTRSALLPSLLLLSAATALAARSVEQQQATGLRKHLAIEEKVSQVELHSPLSPRKMLRPLSTRALVNLKMDDDFQRTRYAHVSLRKYTDLRNGIETLLRKYNPKDYYFIGTGRDPAPLIAMLENLGGRNLAMNFPASNITGDDVETAKQIRPKLLDAYFHRLIPDEKIRQDVLFGNRTIVLLDQSSSGKTPDSFAPYLRKYLNSIRSKVKIAKVTFTQSVNAEGIRSGVDHIATDSFPDVGRYLYAPYEGVVSRFPHHTLGQDAIEELIPRPEYERFKDAVYARMQRDLELHRFLTRELGVQADPQVEKDVAPKVQEIEREVERKREREEGRLARQRAAEEKRLLEEKRTEEERLAAERLAAEKAERAEQRRLRRESKDFPQRTSASLTQAEEKMKPVGDNESGFFSRNGQVLSDWLQERLDTRAKIAAFDAPTREAGPNPLVALFVRTIDRALDNGLVRHRDYRRLLAQALSATELDERMIVELGKLWGESHRFRGTLRKQVKFFTGKGQHPAHTENGEKSYRALMARLAPDFDIEKERKREKKKKDETVETAEAQ